MSIHHVEQANPIQRGGRNDMTRFDRTVRTITVRHIANPLGRNRENPPHLGDLRAFVAECEGLPDDLWVRIDNGIINESGRRDTTFEVSWAVQVTARADIAGACAWLDEAARMVVSDVEVSAPQDWDEHLCHVATEER